MINITGLDSLQRELSEAQKALETVNGELGTLTFKPEDPASIEAAIAESERLVDERLGPFAGNSIVGPLIQEMKDAFRTAVLDEAAKARLEEDKPDDE